MITELRGESCNYYVSSTPLYHLESISWYGTENKLKLVKNNTIDLLVPVTGSQGWIRFSDLTTSSRIQGSILSALILWRSSAGAVSQNPNMGPLHVPWNFHMVAGFQEGASHESQVEVVSPFNI